MLSYIWEEEIQDVIFVYDLYGVLGHVLHLDFLGILVDFWLILEAKMVILTEKIPC